MWIFIEALRHFDRIADLERRDTRGRWAEKMARWAAGLASRDPAYVEQHRFDGVLRLAFPELTPYLPEVEREYFNEDDLPPF